MDKSINQQTLTSRNSSDLLLQETFGIELKDLDLDNVSTIISNRFINYKDEMGNHYLYDFIKHKWHKIDF
jgi:hypothetical protein